MKVVLLSFDIEEFDMPIEYGRQITLEEQVNISSQGTKIILDLLKAHDIRATFFSTVVFARHAPTLIGRIVREGHELASHGFYHSTFEDPHLLSSKTALEELSGQRIWGFRMPRMKAVDDAEVQRAGYAYNSSINPVYLPGRYNNFFKPRKLFKSDHVVQLPASAIPVIRFPLFWLSFHNLPLWIYKLGCQVTMMSDHYLNIYFHPWEFTDLGLPGYGFPKYVYNNSGVKMSKRFNAWITWMKSQDYTFSTIKSFLDHPTKIK